jgi:hypothetical protein
LICRHLWGLLLQLQPPAADGIAAGPGAGGEPGTAGGARPLSNLQAGGRSSPLLLGLEERAQCDVKQEVFQFDHSLMNKTKSWVLTGKRPASSVADPGC